ncbi:MAG: hypothetical protein AAGE52_34330, partial [Myxococcota bacterium]
MKLVWKRTSGTLAPKQSSHHRRFLTDEHLAVFNGRDVQLVSLETLEAVAAHPFRASTVGTRGGQCWSETRALYIDGAQLRLVDLSDAPEPKGDFGWVIQSVEGPRVLASDQCGLGVIHCGAKPTLQARADIDTKGYHFAAIEGEHVVVHTSTELRAFRLEEASLHPVPIAMPSQPGHYSSNLAFAGGRLFWGMAEADDLGTILVFEFVDGEWRVAHRVEGPCRWFRASRRLLAVPDRAKKKMAVYTFGEDGAPALSKSMAKGHYWGSALIADATIVVPNGKARGVDVWRGREKAATKTRSKKAAPAVVRELPVTGALDGQLAHLRKVAKAVRTPREFAGLCQKADAAWKVNAPELEAALPEIGAILEGVSDEVRTLHSVPRYPDAPGWVRLARGGVFDGDYQSPKDHYGEMGRCPLPAHFRVLHVEHVTRLRGAHVAAMLRGAYLRELRALTLKGKIGNKGALAIRKATLPHLTTLDVGFSGMGLPGVQALAACAALRSLGLQSEDLGGLLTPLAASSLTNLRLLDCRLTDADVASLAGLALTELDLRRNRLSEAVYAALGGFALR